MKRIGCLKTISSKCLCLFICLLAILLLPANSFGLASNGSDGAFHPTSNITLDLPSDGIFNFTSVTIPAGVKVTFKLNAINTPVYLLATEDIIIDGIIDVSGGALGDKRIAGPGGFNGGLGGDPGTIGHDGEGPGFGCAGLPRNPGGGGGFATPGDNGKTDGCVNTPGQGGAAVSAAQGISHGGSGGGGGGGGAYGVAGCAGGGGGGVIYISTQGDILINGKVLANGGGGTWCHTTGLCGIRGGPGGGGSGGFIKVDAHFIVLGENGKISCDKGPGGVRSSDGTLTHFGGDGGYGYIVLKAASYQLDGDVTGSSLFGCLADFDDDGDVDVFDLGIFAADFGRTDCLASGGCDGDFDGDHDVDVFDLGRFAAEFGRTNCL